MDKNTRELIDQAMRTKSKLYANFDFVGGARSGVIIPVRWTSTGELCAFSVESNGEIFIHPSAMHRCEIYDPNALPKEQKQDSLPAQSKNQVPGRPQFDPANVPVSAQRLVRKKNESLDSTADPNVAPGIDDVKNSEDWRHLMLFYRECLIHEYRQKFIIDTIKTPVHFFDHQQDEIDLFLEGKTTFVFEEDKQRTAYKYVTPNPKRKDLQLYIGYPVFVVEANKLAPILIAPIEIKESQHKITLTADDFEVSYAALASLKLTDEEISSVLESLNSISSERGQSTIQSVIDHVIEEISKILGDDLKRLKSRETSLQPNAIVYRPCFFWAQPDSITASLLKELKGLSESWTWAPPHLKYLVSTAPENEYPKAPTESQDRNVYVAPVYENQRRAISAAMSEPITIVTGPPGTGKSQFILNLIVQAVLRGEKVLFASKNNKAVNVVMDRLQNEVGFLGAIRTGKREVRRLALNQISARLKNLVAPDPHPEDMDALDERYRQVHRQYLQKLSHLKKVRSKTSLKASRISEVEDIKKLLPIEVWSKAEKYIFSFNDDEFTYIQGQLSSLRVEALQLKSMLDTFIDDLKQVINGGSDELPLIMHLKNYEDQWGAFSNDLLHPDELESVQSVTKFLNLWMMFIKAAEHQNLLNSLLADYREQKASLEKIESPFSEKGLAEIRTVAEKILPQNIDLFREISKNYLSQAGKLLRERGNLWLRIMTWLGFDTTLSDLSNNLRLLQNDLQMQTAIPEKPKWKDLELVYRVSAFSDKIIEISYANYQIAQMKEKIDDARRNLDSATKELPGLISGNLKKINPPLTMIGATKDWLQKIIDQSTKLNEIILKLKKKIQDKLDNNADEIEFLQSLGNADPDRQFDLWTARLDTASPQSLVDLLSSWRMILSYWKALDTINILTGELKNFPSEEKLMVESREVGEILFGLGAKILTSQWKKNAREQDTTVFEQAELHVSVAQQLLEEHVDNYSQLKTMEEQSFPSVMKLFPVWATTNLSTKLNFPFAPQSFDLVIIDEASQSDFPSALPLLYRASRMVIVGDAMQLRHVAKILKHSEYVTSLKHDISLVKYSYSKLSLFDVALRSVQPNPSSILLNEHYRSDPQIFGFSKEEFYSEELKIHTDMFRFSLPPDYMKDGTGVFWVDVPGAAQHPSGGSAYNSAEIQSVLDLTRKLLSDLKRRNLNNLNFGIISPYREQQKRLSASLNSLQGTTSDFEERIITGTAHTFQGDERDIVIFSPVLSQGIKDKSLDWLEKTSNLLNVAVSRARITMIVVGDLKYCLSLDSGSKYRKLAEYVGRHPGRVVNSVDALPLFKGMPIDIIGVLLDRHNRERNRITLQKLLLSCDQFVYWTDPFITNHIFDLFFDIAKHPEFKLKDIRILTSHEQTENEYNPLKPELIRDIQKEFRKNDITIQLGLLPKNQMPHDRHFYSAGYAINMPPFGGAYGDHKMVSEYTESKTKIEFFESYWSKAKKH